jgi:hypothetical protein
MNILLFFNFHHWKMKCDLLQNLRGKANGCLFLKALYGNCSFYYWLWLDSNLTDVGVGLGKDIASSWSKIWF